MVACANHTAEPCFRIFKVPFEACGADGGRPTHRNDTARWPNQVLGCCNKVFSGLKKKGYALFRNQVQLAYASEGFEALLVVVVVKRLYLLSLLAARSQLFQRGLPTE